MRPERADLSPGRTDLRAERADLRELGGGTDGRTNGRTDGRTNEQKSPCVLQDFVPFRAAAQKLHR